MNNLLGPYGKATIILMKAQFDSELPTVSAMKKALKIPDGKYFRSHGRQSYQIQHLEQLLEIIKTRSTETIYYSRDRMSTDYFVTVAGVHSDIFAMMKYSAQIVAGFNLTVQDLADLNELLNKRSRVCNLRCGPASWVKELHRNIELARDMDVTDQTILNVDIQAVERITQNYGLPSIEEWNQKLDAWYEDHRWKTTLEEKGWDTNDQSSDLSELNLSSLMGAN